MAQYKNTFQRIEKKYILNEEKYNQFCKQVQDYMIPDEYGQSTICNIYFDTPTFSLIRESIDKPLYKEKLRFRTYGVPNDDTNSFVEIKKKYNGVVYKRRISMPYIDGFNMLVKREKPEKQSQVFREIDYMFKLYPGLQPAMYISYNRTAYFNKDDENLRITYDSNITWRREELDLRNGVHGRELLKTGERVMEIKIPGSMPIWLSGILDELKIFPASYSKYGTAYKIWANETNFLN